MQLLIDTEESGPTELRAAIALLQAMLPPTAGETADQPRKVVDELTVRLNLDTSELDEAVAAHGLQRNEAAPTLASLTSLVPPPPPPLLPHETDAADDDLDVGTDGAGNVTSLTTAVPLPPALSASPPVAPIPAPPGPAVAAELDSRGYPWDNRIHASNRSKKLDGSWKNKRGVDPNLIVACEAQNKPGPTAAPAAAIATAAGAATTAASVASAPLAPPPPFSVSVPPATPSAAAVSSAPTTGAIDFRGLMMKIQTGTAAGKLTSEQVNAALATVGLTPTDMPQLIGNALYVASVNAAIDKALAA